MDIQNDYCPRCKALRKIIPDEEHREVCEENGTRMLYITQNFYCEKCHVFVKSETRKCEYAAQQVS